MLNTHLEMENFDQETYKAFGSFAPVYTEAKRYLMDHENTFGRTCVMVLDALAQHANPLGLLYAGYKRLMDVTAYSETTVRRALAFLFELDWVRKVEIEVPELGETVARWQISPAILWIANEQISRALELWKNAAVICNEIIHEQPDSFNQIPDQIPEPATYPDPQPTNQPNQPRKGSWLDGIASADFEGEEPLNDGKGEEPEKQKDKAQSATSREATTSAKREPSAKRESTSPPYSAAPPPPLSECKMPLPDQWDEKLAERIKANMATRMPQARQLIRQHGRDQVLLGIRWLMEEQKKPYVIKSEFALLKWWLDRGAVSPGDEPPTEEDRYEVVNFPLGGD